MNASAGEPPSMTSGWQQTPAATGTSRMAIYGRRLLLLLILIGVLGVLAYFVLWLFWQPDTHLAVLHADGLGNLKGPPIAVAGQELTQLELLTNELKYLSGEEFDELFRSPKSMQSLSDVFGRLSVESYDTFILYVAAHGVTYDGKAQLLCSNFDPNHPNDGLFPIETLLEELKGLPAETTKLLILDAGQLDYDPRLGIVVSDFPRLLAQDVKETRDPKLWVLCSHSVAEKSHRSRALKGSVFGTFVARGLRGEAAPVGGTTIDLVGLSKFVTQSVETWVNQSSDGQARQTPQLIWGGQGDRPEEELSLLSVSDGELPGLMEDTRAAQPPDFDATSRGLLSRAVTTPEEGLPSGAPHEAPAAADSPEGQASAPQGDAEPDQTAGNGTSPDSSAANSEAEDRGKKLGNLIARAWKLRDRMSSTDDLEPSRSRAVDETPHLWRELQEELLAYEHVLTSGQADETELLPLEGVLEAALPLIGTSQDDQQDLVHNLSTLKNGETSSPMAGRQVVLDDPRSLALAKLASDHGWYVPADNIDELLAQLKDDIRQPPAEFSLWVSEKTSWEAHYDRYYELRLVKELSSVGNLTPLLYQLALLARCEGERIAASEPWCSDWIQGDIETADRLRLAGERQILAQIGSEWPQRADEHLTQALNRYRAAEGKLSKIRRAARLRNDLVFRVPYYVRWHRASRERSGDDDALSDLSEFLDILLALSSALDAPAGHNVADVNRLCEELLKTVAVKDREIRSLNQISGNAWRVDRLLATPLPSSQDRQGLLGVAQYLDEDLAKSFVSKAVGPGARGADWRRFVSLCDLEMKVARLATWQAEAEDPFQTLQDAFAMLQKTLPTSSETVASSAANKDWPILHEFTQSLREFYSELYLQVEYGGPPQDDVLHRAAEHRRAVRGKRALQLINARDAWRLRDVQVANLFDRLHLHDMLVWHRQRFVVAQSDARPTEYQYLRTAADTYRLQALKFIRSPAATVSAGQQFHIESPELVSLMDQSERDVSVAFTYRGAAETDAWVILQYDPDLISVRAPSHIYHEHELAGQFDEDLSNAEVGHDTEDLRGRIQRAREYPYRPDLASHPASFRGLLNSDTRSLHLTVATKTDAVDSAQIVVKVITPPRQNHAAGQRRAPASTYLRHPIAVTLRTFDLVVDGDFGSWTPPSPGLRARLSQRERDLSAPSGSQHEWTLHPFPNRITGYRLAVVNTGKQDRDVTLRFMIPSGPVNLQQLAREDIAELVSNAASLDPITVTVPADGVPHPLGKVDAEQPAEGADGEAAPEAEDAAAGEEPQPPTGPALTYGLLVEMSDAEDPRQKLLRHIKVVPQRPRRFVRPQVSYNARLERIEVKVLPRDELLLPAGPVKVECEIAEDLASGTEGKLHDTLEAPHKLQAGLFVNVPATTPQLLTLYIHVDDYPRAFVYKVPCGGQALGLPEATELLHVRLLAPDTIDGYQRPAATTPIEIQVDAPVGSFEKGGDRLAIALDLDRDTELDAESTGQFTVDRQTDSFLSSFLDGKLSLDTRVTDFQSPLPTNRLQNVHVDVLGRIDVGETGSEVEPLTLKIDGAPPRIIWIALNPSGGTVLAGNELEVTVWSRDNMSGVKSVQAAFDIDGIGKFAPGAELMKFALDPFTRRWNAKFATEELLGLQTLLVQTTDRVGNASQVYPVPIQVLTEQQTATVAQARPIFLQGIVTFNGKPIPNAQLQLTAVDGPEDGAEIPPVATNEQGQFTFLQVLPGVYNLAARGVVYNVPRRGFRELMIVPNSGRILQADVELQ